MPAAPAGESGVSVSTFPSADVELALGTDSGGSIRIPAAWCGIVGFKPTYDLVPTGGCFPLAPSYDHLGPMGPTVETCIDVMGALLRGFSVAALDSLARLHVGVAWLEGCDPLVRERVRAAAAVFPRARPVEFPFPDRAEYAIFMREAADVHRGLFPEQADSYGDNVRMKLERCLAIDDAAVAAGVRARADYRRRAEQALAGLDLLLTPTVEFVAPPDDVDELAIRERGIRLTYPFDSLGWPALALPCGPAEDGLPASVQLVGRPGDDARVLAVGALLASLVRGTAAR